ncbi:MAG: endonuclease [Syntrophobacteraceae bacterium]
MARNRYEQIIERLFFDHYKEGAEEVAFDREEIVSIARQLEINLPKNLGDIIYSFRYRAALPQSIRDKAPADKAWIIRPAGRGLYKFVAILPIDIIPNPALAETKVPNATPGIVEMYALSDEQALLAKVRYNRLIDIFTCVTCYSLQNHLRTYVEGMGQVETDELYVGLDRKGVHYVFPVQAKGRTDKLNIVQMEQDFAVCGEKFPNLVCHAIGAQFMEADMIALFMFEMSEAGVALLTECHYRLVPPDQISEEDLRLYRTRIQEE